ncbi:uncharacterized protein LOC118407334 [Branchiostoma floridae]|uniref:Uncharacterized protein LOC118407334 n=1 Tax=Branchiostoma floridae TaxID=7739 RepID=A0A9J7HUL7_BRAFL|nr:uncharacterized protein LOC118407334 [Branchiostoma floridae]
MVEEFGSFALLTEPGKCWEDVMMGTPPGVKLVLFIFIFNIVQDEDKTQVSAAYVCDPGWQQFGTSCFQIHNSPLRTHADAKAVCSADGSLAMPKDRDTNDFLVGLIRDTDQSVGTWIGLRYDVEGTWSDGTAFQPGVYSNWGDGEPNGDGHCVHFFPSSSPDGYKERWNDNSCDETLMFICQKEAQDEDQTPVPTNYVCDPEWQQFGSSCFQIHNSPLRTYPDAEAVCSADGSLAMPKDRDTNDFLVSMIRDTDTSMDTWIGLRVDQWMWSDGTMFQPAVYSNWADGEPSADGNCVHYFPSSFPDHLKEKWNDASCDVTFMFICQKEGTESLWQQIGGGLKSVSVGRAGVWGVSGTGQVLCRIGTYENETSPGTGWAGIPGGLDQVSSGINIVWGFNVHNDVFVRSGISAGSPGGSGWTTVPGKLRQVSVSSSSNQVWGIDPAGNVLRRTGITQDNPTGTDWQQIPSDLGLDLESVSVGRAGVWGVNSNYQIFYRTGTAGNETSPGTAWLPVSGGLAQISSGDGEVWGADVNNYVFVRRGISAGTPEGTSWEYIEGNMREVHISASSNQVWGVDTTGNVFRRLGQQPPTQAISTSSNQVWGVDTAQHVYRRLGQQPPMQGANGGLGKPAFQTSTLDDYEASRAVDGIADTDLNHGSCAVSRVEEEPVWWVDLGQSYVVERVVIFNRQDCCAERLNPFHINIGDTPETSTQCGGDHQISLTEPSISVSCPGMQGRLVAVILPGTSRTLSLCEVHVFAVVIFNRQDCCSEQLNPFNIHIGDSYEMDANPMCGGDHHIGLTQPSISVSCPGMQGQFVVILLPGTFRILSLCEVQVFLDVNLALGKTTFMTSGPDSSLAVDGNTDTTHSRGSCIHTYAQGEPNPTWWVDLGQSYGVGRVVIFNRMDCCSERLNPFNIHIGDSEQVSTNPQCGGDHHIVLTEPSISVSCPGMLGRYVAVRLPGSSRVLSVCEVLVFSVYSYKLKCHYHLKLIDFAFTRSSPDRPLAYYNG